MTKRGGPRYRSTLFAPPNHIDWLLDAASLGADAVMFDLEDMVPIAEKASARNATAAGIERLRMERLGRFVRINGWRTGHVVSDLLAIVRDGLDGVALPKAETADEVRALDLVLTELEHERNLPPGVIEILPLPETAHGIYFSYELASASARVKRFYGVMNATREGDGARSLRLKLGRDGEEWIPVGVHVLMAARAAGISNILGATAMEPDNLDRVRQLAERSQVYGANGALCIDPRHVPIVNEVYSPTQAEIDHARALLVAMTDALARGESSALVGGELVTYSHARAALDTVALARGFGLDVGEVPDVEVLSYTAD